MKTSYIQRNSTLKSHTLLKRGTSKLSHGAPMKRSYTKRTSPDSLQEQCDKVFSPYIRRMHADSNGWVQCVTCGITRRWNDRMDAGHFIDRQHIATRYDIYNVFPQCIDCNRYNQGRIPEFTQYLINAFGEMHIQELKKKAQEIVHSYPYKEKIEEFKQKLKIIVENSNGIEY